MRACRSHTHLYEFIRAKLAAGVAEGAVKGDARKVGVGDVHTRVEVLHCVCVCVCVCARARARVRAAARGEGFVRRRGGGAGKGDCAAAWRRRE